MAIIIKKQAVDGTVTLTPLQRPLAAAPTPPPTQYKKTSTTPSGKAAELQSIAGKKKRSKKAPNLFEEVLANSAQSDEEPAEVGDPAYTTLHALAEFAAKKFPKKTLTIVHKTMPTHKYVVKEFDPDSGRAKLLGGFKGGTLKPVITERESVLYSPKWY